MVCLMALRESVGPSRIEVYSVQTHRRKTISPRGGTIVTSSDVRPVKERRAPKAEKEIEDK